MRLLLTDTAASNINSNKISSAAVGHDCPVFAEDFQTRPNTHAQLQRKSDIADVARFLWFASLVDAEAGVTKAYYGVAPEQSTSSPCLNPVAAGMAGTPVDQLSPILSSCSPFRAMTAGLCSEVAPPCCVIRYEAGRGEY